MDLTYVGTGYVGQVNAAAAAKFNHNVILVDIIKEKIDSINAGNPTIYEVGLDELLQDLVLKKKTLRGTLDIHQSVLQSDVVFLCVGTPDKGGMIDLSYIKDASAGIGTALKETDDFKVVVVKSTVVPGTTLNTVLPIIEKESGKKAGVDFGIAMNPEFLREGVALDDALFPDSIVLGVQDAKTQDILTALYSKDNAASWVPENKITYVGISEAESIKYAKNSFLAMKITFANEWANFCQTRNIDVKQVMEAIGKDSRISPMFLRNGPGYGGSCFPKDVNAIVHEGQVHSSSFRVLEQVVQSNSIQYLQLINLAQSVVGTIKGKKIAVLGLSFKPNTDDVRESPSLKIISYLSTQGCTIQTYCPKGMPEAKHWLKKNRITDITYTTSIDECVAGVDLIIIPTDWKEFKQIIGKTDQPIFIGHRSFVEPEEFNNVYALGYPIK